MPYCTNLYWDAETTQRKNVIFILYESVVLAMTRKTAFERMRTRQWKRYLNVRSHRKRGNATSRCFRADGNTKPWGRGHGRSCNPVTDIPSCNSRRLLLAGNIVVPDEMPDTLTVMRPSLAKPSSRSSVKRLVPGYGGALRYNIRNVGRKMCLLHRRYLS